MAGDVICTLRRHARACRGHPRLAFKKSASKAWMAGTSPAMTMGADDRTPQHEAVRWKTL
jgi:hypothetical protein